MLLVNTEGQAERTHLLLYYGDVCKRLFAQFTEQETSDTLGPHTSIATLGQAAGEKESSWMIWENPLLETCSAIEVKNRYIQSQRQGSKNWIFKKRYWDAFADKTDGILAYNISEFLFEKYPGETGKKHAEQDIQEFVLGCMQRAKNLQLTSTSDMELFTACSLLYGESFYQTKVNHNNSISDDSGIKGSRTLTTADLKRILAVASVAPDR